MQHLDLSAMLPNNVDESCVAPLGIKSVLNCWILKSIVLKVVCAPLVCGVDAAIVLDC